MNWYEISSSNACFILSNSTLIFMKFLLKFFRILLVNLLLFFIFWFSHSTIDFHYFKMIDDDVHIDHNNWTKIEFIENFRWNIWQKTKAKIQTNAKKIEYDLIIRRSDINKFIKKNTKLRWFAIETLLTKRSLKKNSVSVISTTKNAIVFSISISSNIKNWFTEKHMLRITITITKFLTKSFFLQYIVEMK